MFRKYCFLFILIFAVVLLWGLQIAQAQTTCSLDQVMCYPCSGGGAGWCQSPPCSTCGDYVPPASPTTCTGDQIMCAPCGGGASYCQSPPCPTCDSYTPPPYTPPAECGGGMVRCYGTNDTTGWCQNPPCPVTCPSGQWKCYTSTSDATGYCSSTTCPPMVTTPATCTNSQIMCYPCGGGAGWCQTGSCPTCGVTPATCPSGQWRCYASSSDSVGYCSSTACPAITSTQITCPSGQNTCYPCGGGAGWCQTGSCPTCGVTPATCPSGQWRCYASSSDSVGYCSSTACPAMTTTPTACSGGQNTCYPCGGGAGWCQTGPCPSCAVTESPATCVASGGTWCYGTNGGPGWCQGGGGVCPAVFPAPIPAVQPMPFEYKPAEMLPQPPSQPKMDEASLKREKKVLEREIKYLERDVKQMFRKDKTTLEGFSTKIKVLREKLNAIMADSAFDNFQDIRDEMEDMRFASRELMESAQTAPAMEGQVGPTMKPEMDEKMQKKALRNLQIEVIKFKSQFTRLDSRIKQLVKRGIVVPASISETVAKGRDLISTVSKATDLATAETAMEDLRMEMESLAEITSKVEMLSQLPQIIKMMSQEIKRLESDVKKVGAKVKKLEKQGFSAATDWLANLQGGLDELKQIRDSVAGGNLDWEEDVMSYIGDNFFEKMRNVRENLDKAVALSNLQQFANQVNQEINKAVKKNKTMKLEEAADLINELKGRLAEVKKIMSGKITEDEIEPLIEEMEVVFELRNELNQLLNLSAPTEFEKMIKTLPGLRSPLMLNLPALERLMVQTYKTKTFFAFLPDYFALAE